MKYFYLYIFLLLCLIVFVSYWTTINSNSLEPFNSNKQTFILLGDSILKNDAYVSDGKSIDSLLIEKTNGKTISLAIDHSKIVDVFSQINNIPNDVNNNLTTVFLSAGGNDILSYYVDNNGDTNDKTPLTPMFSAYKKLVKAIKVKVPEANIVLLDIYYPENMTYKQYHNIISEWNNMIYDYSKNKNAKIYDVLKISTILTKPEDFTLGIEPSAQGGAKLVGEMLANY
jgi:lysophospholipase L1-like esterase